MNIEVLTIKLTKELNLHLLVKINELDNEIVFSNEKLNIRAVYEDVNITEAKELYTKFMIESIIEYVKAGILGKVFESANIKLRAGVDLLKTLDKEVSKILKKEDGLITKKSTTFDFNEINDIEDLSFLIPKIYNETVWSKGI